MEHIAVASIAKPRGLRGEVVADLLTDFPEHFETISDVTLVNGEHSRPALIEQHWFQKGRVVLKFSGLDRIEDVENLRGYYVCIDEADSVELDDNAFYEWQLEGCRVVTIAGQEIGTVSELLKTGGTDVLIVRGDGKDFMIPFAEAICPEVDVENKLITVDPPEGLLEF